MADNIIKSISSKNKNTNTPNKNTYHSLCYTNRTISSVSPEIKSTKYKNEMIRKIEDFISKENYSTIENDLKIPSVENKDIMRLRKKRASYLELYQNQSSFSKSKTKINSDNETNFNSLKQSTNYMENENYFREHDYLNMYFNKKHQGNSASVEIKSNDLRDKKQKKETEYLDYKEKLNELFIENSSFNKNKNQFLMQYSKIVRIIHSKKITYNVNGFFKNNHDNENFECEKNILELNDLDLMIHNIFKQKKLYFTFSDFIQTLEKICELIYFDYEEKPKESLVRLAKEYFFEKEENDDINKYTKEIGDIKGKFSIDLREDVFGDKRKDLNNNNKYFEKENNKTFNSDGSQTKIMEEFILEFKFDIKIKIILLSILETLVKIYKFYFYLEVNYSSDSQKIHKNSFNSLINFCSDFDLIPYDFRYEQISIYWNLVINNDRIKNHIGSQKTKLFKIEDTNDPDLLRFKAITESLKPADLGTVFSFSNFCFFLIHISELSRGKKEQYIRKLSNCNSDKSQILKNKCAKAQVNFDSQKSEKFLFLLEKLNRSNGFLKFEEKTCLAFNAKYSLLPPVKVINLIMPSLIYHEILESERAKQIQVIKTCRSTKKRDSIQYKNKNFSLKLFEKLKSSDGTNNYYILDKETERIKEFENLLVGSFIPIEKGLIENLRLKLNDIKGIFDFYSSQFNSFVADDKHKMNFLAFYKFLEDNDLIINNQEKAIGNSHDTKKNSSLETLTKEFKNAFNKSARGIKEYKLHGQDVINIFSELVSIKNINYTNTSKNFVTEGSSKKESERDKKEKKFNIKNYLKFSTIDFPLFMKSLEYLSLKIFFNKNVVDGLSDDSADNLELLNTSMDKFINIKVPSMIKNLNLKKFLIEKSSDKDEAKEKNMQFVFQEKIQNYLKDISHLLKPFYDLYSNKPNQLIDIDRYMRFLKDFSIYPDLVNCNIVKEIYQDQVLIMNKMQMEETRLNKNLSSKGFTEIEKNSLIEFKGFINCIALASQYIKYDVDSNSIQKLIYLLERIHQSNGLKRAMMEHAMINNKTNSFGNYLDILESRYPDFYKVCFPSIKN